MSQSHLFSSFKGQEKNEENTPQIMLTFLRPVPPVGVLIVAGCGADFCINVCLTLLGYFPGHIHAFYILYVYRFSASQLQLLSVEEEEESGNVGKQRLS
jgi:uncharacterized membrane protein YqaE (UPF0057 family)